MAITIVRRGLLPEPPPVRAPGSSGRDGAEYKRQAAALIQNRALMARLAKQPKLTADEEQEAIRRFKATRGVTRYPSAFAAPTQAYIK